MVVEEGPRVNIFEYVHVDRASRGLTNGIVGSGHMGTPRSSWTDRQSDRQTDPTKLRMRAVKMHLVILVSPDALEIMTNKKAFQ